MGAKTQNDDKKASKITSKAVRKHAIRPVPRGLGAMIKGLKNPSKKSLDALSQKYDIFHISRGTVKTSFVFLDSRRLVEIGKRTHSNIVNLTLRLAEREQPSERDKTPSGEIAIVRHLDGKPMSEIVAQFKRSKN
jgi:hypothetical protein